MGGENQTEGHGLFGFTFNTHRIKEPPFMTCTTGSQRLTYCLYILPAWTQCWNRYHRWMYINHAVVICKELPMSSTYLNQIHGMSPGKYDKIFNSNSCMCKFYEWEGWLHSTSMLLYIVLSFEWEINGLKGGVQRTLHPLTKRLSWQWLQLDWASYYSLRQCHIDRVLVEIRRHLSCMWAAKVTCNLTALIMEHLSRTMNTKLRHSKKRELLPIQLRLLPAEVDG